MPGTAWIEYFPRLDDVTTSRLVIEDGHAVTPNTPGLGIEWDWDATGARQKSPPIVIA